MKHFIDLNDKRIDYELRKSRRARRLRLTVYCGGGFVVTAPWHFGLWQIEKFIREKSDWILAKIGIMKKHGADPVFAKNSRKEYLKLKIAARQIAEQRIEYFNRIYNLPYKKISIRNQKTRWGSCSRKGNLNFNYKIALLPEKLADYVIVHELCHLKEFNHSRKFWDLISLAVPDYKEVRKKIRGI